jgi:hypothetical protein
MPTVKRSWDEVALGLSVARCRGLMPTGTRCYEDHRKGSIDGGIIHWEDRRMTKAGIRSFIILALTINDPVLSRGDLPVWLRLWWQNKMTYIAARDLRVRLPASLADLDKARCKAELATVPTDVAGREDAMKWANGGPS